MAEVINLRRARKAMTRKEKEQTAAANRRLHGEPGHVKKLRKLEKRLEDQRLDGHKVDDDEDGA
jgi:DNA-binding IclR family transcriptional regulator